MGSAKKADRVFYNITRIKNPFKFYVWFTKVKGMKEIITLKKPQECFEEIEKLLFRKSYTEDNTLSIKYGSIISGGSF